MLHDRIYAILYHHREDLLREQRLPTDRHQLPALLRFWHQRVLLGWRADQRKTHLLRNQFLQLQPDLLR